MSPRAVRVLAIVLMAVGASATFTGVSLLTLNLFMAPWIGSIGAFAWTVLVAGLAMLIGGALLARRTPS
jgi:hypothetical protein